MDKLNYKIELVQMWQTEKVNISYDLNNYFSITIVSYVLGILVILI